LNRLDCELKVTLGPKVTKGLGAGGRSEVGALAAEESIAAIEEMIGDADLVFITLGLGGGTGSGSAPVIARIAREKGAVVVAVATLPFSFEGTQRTASANAALETLRAHADTVVVVNNNALLSHFAKGKQNPSLPLAFTFADQCLMHAVDGMVGIIRHPGTINLDFADVRTILANGGRGYFGTGSAEGENAAARAMEMATSSHLLGSSGVRGAKKVLVYFRGYAGMADVNEAMTRLDGVLDLECDTIFGYGPDSELGEHVEVTLFAVGVEEAPPAVNAPRAAAPAVPVPLVMDARPLPAHAPAAQPLRAPNVIEPPVRQPQAAAPQVALVEAEPLPVFLQGRRPAAPIDTKALAAPADVRPAVRDLPPVIVRNRDEEKDGKHNFQLTTDQSDHCFHDELDIPAFLRRRAQR
jgi:cell division protein FtsZ